MPRRFSKSLGKRTHSNLNKGISTLDENEGIHFLESLEADPFILILDQIQDPRNLGACLRSADGAGVDMVVLPADRTVALTDVVRHVAAGAAESLVLMRVRNLARVMREFRDQGLSLLGTSDHAKKTIYEVSMRGPFGLVVGAEEMGMRRLTSDNCNHLAKIPMCGKVDCLNVSVATGVALFEAVRQRNLV